MASPYTEKSVLVVDNSPFMAKLIKRYLVNLGFTEGNVWTSNDGNQATMMLELKSFDLVTSGIHLKMKSGISLLKELRNSKGERLRNLPFIFISSERQEFFSHELKDVAISAYLSKPFSMELFNKTISAALGNGCASATPSPAVPEKPTGENSAGPPPFPHPQVITAFADSMVEALGQYMAPAKAGSPCPQSALQGEINTRIELTDDKHGVKSFIVVYFPKDIAGKIYQGIFGELDESQVPGLVQELANIIGGIVKPKIAGLSQDIYGMVHSGKKLGDDEKLSFNLGLPTLDFAEQLKADLKLPDSHHFAIPFDLDAGRVYQLVQFQKI